MKASMDTITIIIAVAQLLLTIIGCLIGWLVKSLFTAIQDLKRVDAQMGRDLTELRVSLPERYVTKGDFKDSLDAIFKSLRSIEDKLDRKVDKPHHP